MIPECPNTEDFIINKAPALGRLGKRLSREEEFIFNFEMQERTREVKRRLLSRTTNGEVEYESVFLPPAVGFEEGNAEPKSAPEANEPAKVQ